MTPNENWNRKDNSGKGLFTTETQSHREDIGFVIQMTCGSSVSLW